MNNWKETTLGEVIKINISNIGRFFEFNEILYLDTGSITEGRIESLQKVNITDAPSRAKRLVNNYDIVYSTVRPNQKHFGFIENPEKNLVVSTGFTVISVQTELADSKFLYYFLTQNSITNKLQQIAEHSTSTYPSIKPEHIEGLEINLPPLPGQKAIAGVLSGFDDKIELLRRQNETLEKTAQTIFKEWFVDFNFPNKEGKPYKKSGGKMIDSELGEISEGWSVGKSGDLIKLQGGYAFKGEDFKVKGREGVIKIKNIKNGVVNLNNTDFVDSEIVEKIDKKFRIKSGDVLIAMTGAEVAKIGVVANTEKRRWLNQRVGLFRDVTDYGVLYIYFLFTRNKYQSILKGKGDGSSAQPNISSTDVENIEMVLPNKEVLNLFGELIKPIFDKICHNLSSIQTLIKTRDSLLPKLMSGETAFNNF